MVATAVEASMVNYLLWVLFLAQWVVDLKSCHAVANTALKLALIATFEEVNKVVVVGAVYSETSCGALSNLSIHKPYLETLNLVDSQLDTNLKHFVVQLELSRIVGPDRHKFQISTLESHLIYSQRITYLLRQLNTVLARNELAI